MALPPLRLYYHTCSQMEGRQLVGTAERKIRNFVVPRLPIDLDRRYERRIPKGLTPQFAPFAANTELLRSNLTESAQRRYKRLARTAADGNVTFLNRTLRFGETLPIEWDDERFEDLPRLWRLKLYAFEPLTWCVRGFSPDDADCQGMTETFDRWITDWMQSIEVGTRDYLRGPWTPYSVSLRIFRWIRYLAWKKARRTEQGRATLDEFETQVTREIYKNALFLYDHVEHGVGGNHLVENAAALVWAGLVFEQSDWMEEGLSLLEKVSHDQFLDDGGHSERSPMYHVRVITAYLTVCDLLNRHAIPIPSCIREVTQAGVEFLKFIRTPDGRIPLLNDAVYDQTLPIDACLNYAESMGINPPNRLEGAAESSGYYWLDSFGKMLVDGGPVGPPHLPGHSHNDLLQFLLWLDGDRVVTDTGVFDYEAGEKRRYARGVCGHNTVQVGTDEPIDIEGRFLMGPRTTPTVRYTRRPRLELFEGTYRTRPLKSATYRHHRAVYGTPRWWMIRDQVGNSGDRPVRSRLHLGPEISVSERDRSELTVKRRTDGYEYARIHAYWNTSINITEGWYYPRFGETHRRTVLEFETNDDNADALGFVIAAPEIDTVKVNTDPEEGTSPSITIDDTRYDLPEVKLS